MNIDSKIDLLRQWLSKQLKAPQFEMQALTNDASNRRYFRVMCDGKTSIAVDALSEKAGIASFIAKAKIFHDLGLRVPKIFASDIALGFLWLSDLGDDLYLRILSQDNRRALYDLALNTLLIVQSYSVCDFNIFAVYDEALLRREVMLFIEWYLSHVVLTTQERTDLEKIFSLLIKTALSQPQVLVHRDYHSRNLLLLPDKQLGIVDFQDAVWGPITYDLVSLLRDCYLVLPDELIHDITRKFYQHYSHTYLKGISYDEFIRWFDWMGLQRHLKVLGLFTRLARRDQKTLYLKDLPRVLDYVYRVSKKYVELNSLILILDRATKQ